MLLLGNQVFLWCGLFGWFSRQDSDSSGSRMCWSIKSMQSSSGTKLQHDIKSEVFRQKLQKKAFSADTVDEEAHG